MGSKVVSSRESWSDYSMLLIKCLSIIHLIFLNIPAHRDYLSEIKPIQPQLPWKLPEQREYPSENLTCLPMGQILLHDNSLYWKERAWIHQNPLMLTLYLTLCLYWTHPLQHHASVLSRLGHAVAFIFKSQLEKAPTPFIHLCYTNRLEIYGTIQSPRASLT